MNNPKLYLNINLLKIIACFLVIVNHTYSCIFEFSNITFFVKIEYIICRIAVPLFIMCSGYLLNIKEFNIKYLLKKIVRVGIPLLIFSCFIYFLRTENLNFAFFRDFLKEPIIEPYWYLYMLIGLYLIIPYINKMLKNINNNQLLVLIILIFFPSLIKFFQLNISNYLLMNSFSYIIGYYCLGAYFQRNNFSKIPSIILMLFLIIFITMGYLNYSISSIFFIDSIFIIILSSIVFFLILRIDCSKKYDLTFITDLLFIVYLVHPLIQNKILKLIKMTDIFYENVNLGLIIYQFSLLIISLFISFIINRLIILLKEFIKDINEKKVVNS